MLTCEQCRDDMAEYALGHSDPATTAAMAEHLDACVVCRRMLVDVESAWAALPLVLPSSEPSPQVLDRLWQRIGHTTDPQPRPALSPASSGPPLTPRQRLWSYLLAASVVAALVGGAIYLGRADRQLASDDPAAEAALRDLALRLGNLQQIEQLLNSDNVKLASLHAVGAGSNDAYVVWDTGAGQWHFFAPSLPPPPAGQIYQLWAVAEGEQPLAGPTFLPDVTGLGKAIADFPTLNSGATVKAVVTVEPVAGSSAPTGKVVLEAPL